ncbi:MAG: hypothetical protein WDO71_14525 [Bacteroidota bacterium]
MIKKEIYQYKWPNGFSDFIELNYNNDTSAIGVYRGVSIKEDNSLIFFKSNFSIIKSDIVYDLFFKLDSFVFSKTAFQFQSTIDNTIKPITSEIPFIFQYPMTFVGNYSGDTLNIVRNTARDIGSKGENMVFIKVLL